MPGRPRMLKMPGIAGRPATAWLARDAIIIGYWKGSSGQRNPVDRFFQ